MRHLGFLVALFLAGCSTHPIADVMDFARPGRMYANEVNPYGGVCGNQGAVLAPGVGVAPPPPPFPASGGVVPPPVPLPGSTTAPTPFPAAPP
jgi:hypothetical protein